MCIDYQRLLWYDHFERMFVVCAEVIFMAGKKNIVLKVEKKEGEAKQEALRNAVAQLEKDFGKGIFMKMGEHPEMKVRRRRHPRWEDHRNLRP